MEEPTTFCAVTLATIRFPYTRLYGDENSSLIGITQLIDAPISPVTPMHEVVLLTNDPVLVLNVTV